MKKIKYPIWLAPKFGVVMENEVISETPNGYLVQERQVHYCRDGKQVITENQAHVPKVNVLEVVDD